MSFPPTPTESTPRKLRVGFLLDSWTVPAWVARIVDEVMAGDVADVQVVVLNATPPVPRSARRLFALRGQWLYRAYMALDARVFSSGRSPFARVSVADRLANVPVLRVEPRQTRFSDYFPDSDVATLAALDLDVLFRFGFRILRGPVLDVARHGLWSYHHGDPDVNRGGPPCFWEVMNGEPVTGSVLQILSERLDDGQVIYRSWSSTHPYSVHATRARVYHKSAAFAGRCLAHLYRTGRPTPQESPDRSPAPYDRPLYRPPGNAAMVRLAARLVFRMLAAGIRGLWSRETWMIAWRESPVDESAGRLFDVRWLRPPRGAFWADPFVAFREGRRAILFEEWVDRAKKAHISAIELDADGRPSAPAAVLERPYHLSYPFIFDWNDELWMVPETKGNRTVELYRCIRFPDRWQFEATLLADVEAVDATVHPFDGRWWMWLNRAEPGASMLDEVHLFHADTPLGPWLPHPLNPVKSDVRGARPAGRPFLYGGRLVRPAQDGSVRYGYAVVFHRIEVLTTTEYREEEMGRTLPLWADGLLGTHTYNRDDRVTVVDGYRRVPRWR